MIKKTDLIETAYLSIPHYGEELCGDHVEIKKSDHLLVAVLADGMGSGVKANILSTLTSTLIATLMFNDSTLDNAVKSVIDTLPIAKDRDITYSTFSIIVVKDSVADIYNFDNPMPFLIRKGKYYKMDMLAMTSYGKTLYHGKIELETNDTLFLMSDGIINAGVGPEFNFGWDINAVHAFMEGLNYPEASAKALVTLLTDHVDDVYGRIPSDDLTALVLKVRDYCPVNIMIGPPIHKEDDNHICENYMKMPGIKIISGGSTAHMMAKYLDVDLIPSLENEEDGIPPTSMIQGIDLVTEGLVTLNKVLELSYDFQELNKEYFNWCYKWDGVSSLARYLFDYATDINIFLGGAVNSANVVNSYLKTKIQIVEELANNLRKMGKRVQIQYK